MYISLSADLEVEIRIPPTLKKKKRLLQNSNLAVSGKSELCTRHHSVSFLAVLEEDCPLAVRLLNLCTVKFELDQDYRITVVLIEMAHYGLQWRRESLSQSYLFENNTFSYQS